MKKALVLMSLVLGLFGAASAFACDGETKDENKAQMHLMEEDCERCDN